jgi:hypothetical protein
MFRKKLFGCWTRPSPLQQYWATTLNRPEAHPHSVTDPACCARAQTAVRPYRPLRPQDHRRRWFPTTAAPVLLATPRAPTFAIALIPSSAEAIAHLSTFTSTPLIHLCSPRSSASCCTTASQDLRGGHPVSPCRRWASAPTVRQVDDWCTHTSYTFPPSFAAHTPLLTESSSLRLALATPPWAPSLPHNGPDPSPNTNASLTSPLLV